MVIKDIVDHNRNIELFIDEQLVDNKRYRVSKAFSPRLEPPVPAIRITVSTINELADYNHYEEVHGFDFIEGTVRSFYLYDDIKRSTHENKYLDDKMGYYEEVMQAFDGLIESGKSDLSEKSLNILSFQLIL